MTERTVKIDLEIPVGLYERLKGVLEEGEKVEEVILQMIRKFVSEREVEETTYTPEEEEEIRKRLKELGYIE
jgi:predicted CopG family antitoxin